MKNNQLPTSVETEIAEFIDQHFFYELDDARSTENTPPGEIVQMERALHASSAILKAVEEETLDPVIEETTLAELELLEDHLFREFNSSLEKESKGLEMTEEIEKFEEGLKLVSQILSTLRDERETKIQQTAEVVQDSLSP